MKLPTYTPERAARAAALHARAEQAAAQREADKIASLPADLRALVQQLQRDLRAEIVSIVQAPAPKPPRNITVDEVAKLDARDPLRAMYQQQRIYSDLRRPVPQHITAALRQAWRDEQARRR